MRGPGAYRPGPVLREGKPVRGDCVLFEVRRPNTSPEQIRGTADSPVRVVQFTNAGGPAISKSCEALCNL